MGGGAVCTNPGANIAPGASTTLILTFKLPKGAGSSVTSCASVSWGGAPTGSSVRDVQQALNQRGLNVGRPDGKAGRKTVNAIRTYQGQNGLQASGEIDLPLLMSLFTTPGAGDVNRSNDQACAGSAVFSAPAPSATFNPRPKATYCADGRLRKGSRCVCPAVVPVWTGRTCVPRKTRNCTGGRYYSKKRKLCLCPSSKPHWYNNRCYAGVDDCPGDSVRVGNQCIKENDPAFDTRHGGLGVACPSGTFRVGNNCVQQNTAPLFTFGRKPKGSGQVPVLRQQQVAPPPPPIVKQLRPPAVLQPACISNQVRLGNGQCGCPSNKPSWSKGRCKKLKGINKFLNQMQQPQNQPLAQPQQQQQNRQLTPKQQQQQQIQQGVDKLIKQFSDARLKRGIEYLVTLENGIKLYSFRYLWDDVAYVGVMAQDLLRDPAWRDAVTLTPSGYYLVDYGALGLRMMTLEYWRARASRGSGASRAAADLRSN